MISQDAPTVTDELIAELEAAANAATPGPWDHIRINDISWVASEDWEILDLRCDKPLDAEDGEYIAKANPTTIMALLAHIADLKQQLAAASVDAERLDWLESAYCGHTGHDGGFHLSAYMPKDAETLREMVDAAQDIAAMDIGSGD